MKHLKKVQLFRVGFDEKVSLEEKFFLQALVCNERPGIKKWQPKGLPYKFVQNWVVQN
ncbi:MAG: hypothetical protein SAqTSB_29220 [Shewanella algae]